MHISALLTMILSLRFVHSSASCYEPDPQNQLCLHCYSSLFYLVSTEKDTCVMRAELPTLPRDDYSFA